MKYYIAYENERNVRSFEMYERLLRLAFGDAHEIVLPGHHFIVAPNGPNMKENLKKMNEIPSADTILFDHDIMKAVFGQGAIDIMSHLAVVPADERDALVEQYLNMREGNVSEIGHAQAD